MPLVSVRPNKMTRSQVNNRIATELANKQPAKGPRGEVVISGQLASKIENALRKS